jgi:DNA-binding GntR family transcriptional regulator
MRALATKPDLTTLTHEAIRKAIMSGELAPCAPLAQEELAERLGVSRQPVSHALILLKREGLVVDRGRKGQMVAPIDAAKLRDLYQVRSGLDRLAARLAAARLLDANDLTQRFARILDQGQTAMARNDISLLVDADVAFHTLLHDLSGNPEIASMAAGSWPHMVRSMRVVLEDRSKHATIWAEHRAIADAVIAGDAGRAGTLAEQHADLVGKATYTRLTTP